MSPSHWSVALFVALLVASLPGLSAVGERSPGGLQVAVLEDADGHWVEPDGSLLDARFQTMAGAALNAGRSDSVWWLRLEIEPAASGEQVLEIGYTQNDRLDLFLPAGAGWKHIRAGDTRPRPAELLRHPTPALILPIDFDGPIYVRVESQGSVQVPLAVFPIGQFIERAVWVQFGYGLYFSALLAMAVYNLFLYLAIRDKAYLFYVGYLGGLLLFQASLSGHAGLWLWPNWPQWVHLGTVAGVALMLALGAGFVGTLAQTRRLVPWGHRLLWLLAGLALLVLPALVWDYRVAIVLASLLSLVAVSLIFPITVGLAYLRGCRQARFLALGVLLFLPGVVGIVLRTLGVLSPSWWNEHLLQIGTAAEAMLFSFALADRINTLNQDKLAAKEAVVTAHDSERRRIARDLHDGLGQNLLLLAGRVRRLAGGSPESGPIERLLDGCIGELRSASRDLYPHQLDRLGLNDALDSMLEQALRRTGILVDAHLAAPAINDAQALHVYRITQEAISNIVRHAQASAVSVRLQAVGDQLNLSIKDDGRGFDPGAVARGLGLIGMRSRAEILGGHLAIVAAPGRGVAIDLSCRIRP